VTTDLLVHPQRFTSPELIQSSSSCWSETLKSRGKGGLDGACIKLIVRPRAPGNLLKQPFERSRHMKAALAAMTAHPGWLASQCSEWQCVPQAFLAHTGSIGVGALRLPYRGEAALRAVSSSVAQSGGRKACSDVLALSAAALQCYRGVSFCLAKCSDHPATPVFVQ
jgi:hypothetical protein